jgi:hypothetical protein
LINLCRKWSTIRKADWSCGCVSAIDSNGRTIWIADPHRDEGKRFDVHADEKLTTFLKLEFAICAKGFWVQSRTQVPGGDYAAQVRGAALV